MFKKFKTKRALKKEILKLKEQLENLQGALSIKQSLEKIQERCNDSVYYELLTSGSEKKNEEAAKHAFTLLLLTALGYNTTDTKLVLPERSVRIKGGSKHPKRVDYAVRVNNVDQFIVEAKAINVSLSSGRFGIPFVDQVKAYFDNIPTARVALLTNGHEYLFFAPSPAELATQGSRDMSVEPIFSFSFSLPGEASAFRCGELTGDAAFDMAVEKLEFLKPDNFKPEELMRASIEGAVKHNITNPLSVLRKKNMEVTEDVVNAFRLLTSCPQELVNDEALKRLICEPAENPSGAVQGADRNQIPEIEPANMTSEAQANPESILELCEVAEEVEGAIE